jgi:predicted dehydrogenase
MSCPQSPYRVGIAGAGAFAAFLAGALATLPEFQLAAVAGRTDEKRQRVLAAYRNRRPTADVPREYREATELISDPTLDVVILSTPPHLHASLGELALTKGKHVLLEKPGALSAEALTANIRLAAKHRRAIAVNLVLRYSPLVEVVTRILRERLLGRPYHASLHNAAHRVAPGHWFWSRESSGGIFVEHGVHFFEVGRHWFGEAASAQGSSLIEASGEESRFWASVLHRQESGLDSARESVPVQYYHGFTLNQEVPESTQWIVHCAQGRIVLHGWIPERLTVSGMLSPDQAARVDALLDAVPSRPTPHALDGLRQDDRSPAAPVSDSPESRKPYQRTVELADREGWYEAMAQARFLDFCRMIQDPNWSGLVTPEDAAADLALAEMCTPEQPWRDDE